MQDKEKPRTPWRCMSARGLASWIPEGLPLSGPLLATNEEGVSRDATGAVLRVGDYECGVLPLLVATVASTGAAGGVASGVTTGATGGATTGVTGGATTGAAGGVTGWATAGAAGGVAGGVAAGEDELLLLALTLPSTPTTTGSVTLPVTACF